MNNLGLEDTWRYYNPVDRCFTYRTNANNQHIQPHIDRIYVTCRTTRTHVRLGRRRPHWSQWTLAGNNQVRADKRPSDRESMLPWKPIVPKDETLLSDIKSKVETYRTVLKMHIEPTRYEGRKPLKCYGKLLNMNSVTGKAETEGKTLANVPH